LYSIFYKLRFPPRVPDLDKGILSDLVPERILAVPGRGFSDFLFLATTTSVAVFSIAVGAAFGSGNFGGFGGLKKHIANSPRLID
tara:strand:- start:53 stop:307 length:255 start_codon:yes stop_codon:yes gene_type:complete